METENPQKNMKIKWSHMFSKKKGLILNITVFSKNLCLNEKLQK